MDWQLNISIILSLGGIAASVASSIAIVKTKVSVLEKDIEDEKQKTEDIKAQVERFRADGNVKLTALEITQQNHDRALSEVKSDIKTIMNNVQEIKEIVLKTRKGE